MAWSWVSPSECEWVFEEEWRMWLLEERSSGKQEAYIKIPPSSGWNVDILLGLKDPHWLDLGVTLAVASIWSKATGQKEPKSLRTLGQTQTDKYHLLSPTCGIYGSHDQKEGGDGGDPGWWGGVDGAGKMSVMGTKVQWDGRNRLWWPMTEHSDRS